MGAVFSGAFALALLFATAWNVGHWWAMVFCAASAFAGWGANISEDMGRMGLWAFSAVGSLLLGFIAFAMVVQRVAMLS